MNCARNYENVLNFVKVMPKTLLVPVLSGHGVESVANCQRDSRLLSASDVGAATYRMLLTC